MPPVQFLFLLLQEALHLPPLGLLRISLLPALTQARVDLLSSALLRLLLSCWIASVVLATLLLHMAAKGVTLDDLLRFISQDDCIQAFKRPSTHHIPGLLLINFFPPCPLISVPDTLLFNTKPLYLVVNVEEETVISGAVIARSDEEASRPGPDQQVHGLVLTEISVEPGEYCIRVDGFFEVAQEVLQGQRVNFHCQFLFTCFLLL